MKPEWLACKSNDLYQLQTKNTNQYVVLFGKSVVVGCDIMFKVKPHFGVSLGNNQFEYLTEGIILIIFHSD
jgi:hypothetical protein